MIFRTREEAAALGERRYWSVRECKAGHLGERLVSTGNCVLCLAERQKRRLAEDPEYRQLHRDCSRERARRLLDDPDERKRRRGLEREAAKAPHRRVKDTAKVAARRAKLLQAMPPWLTEEHEDAILAIYREAKQLSDETGLRYEVDHIFPLNGTNSCGLHVPWNLQILLSRDNAAKGNKIDTRTCAKWLLQVNS